MRKGLPHPLHRGAPRTPAAPNCHGLADGMRLPALQSQLRPQRIGAAARRRPVLHRARLLLGWHASGRGVCCRPALRMRAMQRV